MKIKIYNLLIVLIAIFITACSQNDSIQISIDKIVEENDIPGINVSIIDADGNIANYSSGFSDVEKNEKLTPGHTLFTGSIGKTFAVATLMQLVDEGKVDLDKKIKDYFPEVEWWSEVPNIDDITVRMLLEHTSGLTRYVMKPEVWKSLEDDPDKIWTYYDRMKYVFGDKPLNPAGKGWGYSDTNYILIGMLIEKITGNYYYDEVLNRIIRPKRLTDTYPADRRDIPKIANGYSKLPEMFCMPEKVVKDGKYCFNPQMEWTGGGIASSTPDLARWAKIYFEGDLFSEGLHKQIITPNENGHGIGENTDYGMGSFIYHTKFGKAYGHTGFVPGFKSIFTYFPDKKVAVALQINCDYATEKMSLMQMVGKILAEKI